MQTGKKGESEIEIARWAISKREVVRVLVRVYHRHNLIDVRRWYPDIEGKLYPGKGLSLPTTALPVLRRALRKMARHLKQIG